jgi:hypothetical protein
MNEERVFNSVIKVVTRSYGLSNDPAIAANKYAVDGFAPGEAFIILLRRSRFVTVGTATFLVGMPEAHYGGVVYPVAPDTDMDAGTVEEAELWINERDIISIVEDV